MKIVHVVRQFLPQIGGMELAVLHLALAQRRAGHDVSIVTLKRTWSRPVEDLAAFEIVQGLPVHRVGFFGSRRYPVAFGLSRHTKGAEIIHVHGIDFAFDYFALRNVFRRRVLIATSHGGFFHTGDFGWLKRIWMTTITRLSVRSYAAILCVSEQDHARFSALRKEGVLLVYNAIDTDKFRNAASQELNRSIIAISRFSTNKRHDRLIATLKALRKLNPAWRLVIAGSEDDLNARDVRAMIETAGLADAAELAVSPSDATIRTLISNCSIFASASDYEGFGVAAVEAVSAGLLPVLSDIKPYRDLADRTEGTLIVDFANPEASANAIETWWLAKREDTQRECRLETMETFSATSIASQTLDIYERCRGATVREILGVGINVNTFDSAVQALDDVLDSEESKKVIFANAHMLNLLVKRGDRSQMLRDTIVLNDGIGLDIASRVLFRRSFPANLAGTDFVPGYLASTRHSLCIFLLGSHEGVARRAAQTISHGTKHAVVGYCHGYRDEADQEALAREIRDSGADVLFCGMGNLRQEQWLATYFEATGCRLGFGVGALLDFTAGRVPRAPAWARRMRVEWVYRLAIEPRRMARRYLIGNAVFLFRVFLQFFQGARVA